ncbi:MAG TPA: hypothetical protein VJ917_07935 [Saprospiraceae bacterium]|nr:hypothetical protein [Saprospiraceae bacterium]
MNAVTHDWLAEKSFDEKPPSIADQLLIASVWGALHVAVADKRWL